MNFKEEQIKTYSDGSVVVSNETKKVVLQYKWGREIIIFQLVF